ncbi:pyrophosphatase PpaX [Salsuginibacillus kocurii]|uniref:pyrophosphatase PpaX n=1 Tax=Salsuginibacillus kocurii TaxID=427078 RepID=UPI00036EF19E|nr:pyrophosphatase PpaX [Salsuginibacillus kocurii]
MSINAVLFDLDGTLVDTNDLIIASFEHTLASYGYNDFTKEDILSFIGPPLDETFRTIDHEQAEDMVATYREHNIAHHDSLIKEYEGVLETVRTLYEQQYKLAIVTTKRERTAHMGLKAAGLAPYFETVVTWNDVKNTKPDPEPLNLAMEKLGVSPRETAMVGDSHYDIVGAKNAGTQAVGVAWSIKGADHLQSYEPDVMLNHMPELLDWLGVNVR